MPSLAHNNVESILMNFLTPRQARLHLSWMYTIYERRKYHEINHLLLVTTVTRILKVKCTLTVCVQTSPVYSQCTASVQLGASSILDVHHLSKKKKDYEINHLLSVATVTKILKVKCILTACVRTSPVYVRILVGKCYTQSTELGQISSPARVFPRPISSDTQHINIIFCTDDHYALLFLNLETSVIFIM